VCDNDRDGPGCKEDKKQKQEARHGSLGGATARDLPGFHGDFLTLEVESLLGYMHSGVQELRHKL
jgi:hypothetical protein